MQTYIALFRGINVGGRNILPMDELKALLGEMGCEGVETYIQSGNVVFRSRSDDRDTLGKEISRAISKRYGFEPKVYLLDADQLRRAIDGNPFDTGLGKALHFYFLASYPDSPDLDRLDALKAGTEEYRLIDRVFYLYAPDGMGRSKLAANIEKCLGVPATGRNWNTVSRLRTMIEEA